jgi:predicted ATP-binding protein involved in virulence
MNDNLDIMPNYKAEKIPKVKIKTINFNKYKVFDNYTFNFNNLNFACLIGPNGTGKSTCMNIIQLLFSKFNGREEQDVVNYLSKAIRNGEENFLIKAILEYENKQYEVLIDKTGFIKDHPDEIKEFVYRLCYNSDFDRQLGIFQLNRDKWEIFKNLFESVTGYKIYEEKNMFDFSEDPEQADLLRKYVLGFHIEKPNETIHYKMCSDGEKKVIRTFSALLNLEIEPSIILIDNIEMHIELGRHLPFILAMQKSFPNAQIFCTTHSYRISRNFSKKNQIFDLRLIHANDLIKEEPFRLSVIDELDDLISKIKSFNFNNKNENLIKEGESLIKRYQKKPVDTRLKIETENFIKEVSTLFFNDMIGVQISKK